MSRCVCVGGGGGGEGGANIFFLGERGLNIKKNFFVLQIRKAAGEVIPEPLEKIVSIDDRYELYVKECVKELVRKGIYHVNLIFRRFAIILIFSHC